MSNPRFDIFKTESINFDLEDSNTVQAIVYMTHSPNIDEPTLKIDESPVRFIINLYDNSVNIYPTANCPYFESERSYISTVILSFTKELERAKEEYERENSGKFFEDTEDPIQYLKSFEVHY